MSMASDPDGAQRPVEQLQEQIGEHRRELARTLAAVHDKTDIKGRMREKAVGAEIAVTDLAGWAGRTVGTVPRFVRWAATMASDQTQKVPGHVRVPVGQAAGLVRRRIRALLAAWTAVVAVLAMAVMRRRRRG